MLYKELGKNIKFYREHCDLTQKQLGDLIMKSEISVRKYESGSYNIPPAVLLQISEALKIGIINLIGNDLEIYCENNPSFQNTIDLTSNDLKQFGLSWHQQYVNDTSNANDLLKVILDYLQTNDLYFTAMSFPYKNIDNDPNLPYFTDTQINTIVNKVCNVVIEEIDKIEESNYEIRKKTMEMVKYITNIKNINFTKKEFNELYDKLNGKIK